MSERRHCWIASSTRNRTSHKPEEGKGKELQEAVEARELYTRRFIHALSHHRAIVSLCHRFTTYAGTMRLGKRWLASHWLLYSHIGEEAVKLICATLFISDSRALSSGLASVPGTRERGFAAVVEFVKDWKWGRGCLFRCTAANRLTSLQKLLVLVVSTGSKHGVWMTPTEEDQTGTWISNLPVIVKDYLAGVDTGTLDVKVCPYIQFELPNSAYVFLCEGLFVHPVNDYDFITQILQYGHLREASARSFPKNRGPTGTVTSCLASIPLSSCSIILG
jgi:U3 small nucleolar RNA-associated protein 22